MGSSIGHALVQHGLITAVSTGKGCDESLVNHGSSRSIGGILSSFFAVSHCEFSQVKRSWNDERVHAQGLRLVEG